MKKTSVSAEAELQGNSRSQTSDLFEVEIVEIIDLLL
jgi:hypothetical protein